MEGVASQKAAKDAAGRRAQSGGGGGGGEVQHVKEVSAKESVSKRLAALCTANPHISMAEVSESFRALSLVFPQVVKP